ncbi:MAG: YoaK family protein [Gemella sp.]|nr:YoaK family protein [Gemella sp.]
MKSFKILLLDKKLPSHEQVFFALLLTYVCGFFDAYTFVNYNGQFANAQTANIIFIGMELANTNYLGALRYVPPVIAFIIGVLFNEFIMNKYRNVSIARYINLSLLIQTCLLIFAYIVPKIWFINVVPLVISFVCAMQFDSFRSVNKVQFASIFCTGNLRSATEHIFRYVFKKEKESMEKFIMYSALLISFIGGVISGGVLSKWMGHHAILMAILVFIINLAGASIHEQNRYRKSQK